MFIEKSDENIDLTEIKLLCSKFLFDVIEENLPYMWIPEEEPFINKYNGKISYDHSGKVEKMSCKNLKELAKNLGNNPASMCYCSELDELLSKIYVDLWEPSYISNCGKNFISYKDKLTDKFNEWKYNNFDLYDEDGNELNEELDIELDIALNNFLESTSIDMYYIKILKTIA